jgi:methylmalonyl-CoA mutase
MADAPGPLLLEEFPPVTTERWEELVRKDLKGADYAKKLLWLTDEGITVKPFYRSEDLLGLEYLDSRPAQFPYTRGTRLPAGWNIRERIRQTAPVQANQAARDALAAGAEEICFVLPAVHSPEQLELLLAGIPLETVQVHFEAGGSAAQLVHILRDSGLPVRGSIDYDALGDPAEAAALCRAVPDFRVFTIRGDRFYDSGASVVQELGFSLAEAVEILAQLTDRGVAAGDVAAALVFSFAIGSSYFFEIAKLRAARTLWAKVAESFGVPESKAVIHSRSATWNKTVYDPHVNILRATTEAMSAALGGSDAIWVEPFDATYRNPEDASTHLARNTQIILKKEAWFDRTADPAGGSYYVEVLTDSIAREAWKLMQEIESAGGFVRASQSGAIAAQVRKTRDDRIAAVASRRRTILGTNQYPNLKERVLPQIERLDPAERAATVFEEIRLRTERHAASTGRTPRFVLLTAGDLKMRKARAAFVANFFGCAGFEIDTAASIEEARAKNPDVVVLCSSDEEYPVIAGPIVKQAGVPVIVAGYPKDAIERLKQDGVADFVHIRSNAVEVLKAWQDRLGVKR